LFLLNSDVEVYFAYGFKSGSTWTWHYWVNAAVGTSVSWLIFDEPPDTYSNIGIEIYDDAAGLPLLFGMSPSLKPLRVIDFISQVTSTGHTYPSGRTYAFGQSAYSGQLVWEDGALNGGIPDPDYYALIAYATTIERTSGRIFNFATMRRDKPTFTLGGTNTPDFTEERDWNNKRYIIADVTGY